MKRHGALTVVLDVQEDKARSLESLLSAIGGDVENNAHLQFRKSPSTHFARFVLLDGHRRLLFTSNYDGGNEDAYLGELSQKVGSGFQAVLGHCKGWNDQSGSFPSQFKQYLRAHSYPSQTFYIAFRDKSVEDIITSAQVRQSGEATLDCISTCLGSPSRSKGRSPPAAAPMPSVAPGSQPKLQWWEKLIEWAVGIGEPSGQPVTDTVSTQLVAVEDQVVQNQMTVIVHIKPSLWSRCLLRLVLFAASLQVRGTKGTLSNISTIHFARWAIIDGGTKLLFESNYDGSWERYIDDFVDRASVGLNAIWGNCPEFPVGGARDIEAFKKSIRDNQTASQVFYSAYPQSTVVNILNDLRFAEFARDGIPKAMRGLVAGTPVYPD